MQKEASILRKQLASSPYLQKPTKFKPQADFNWKQKISTHNQSMIIEAYEGIDYKSIQELKSLSHPHKTTQIVLLALSLIINPSWCNYRKPFDDMSFWWKACVVIIKDPKCFVKLLKKSDEQCLQDENSYNAIANFVKQNKASFDEKKAIKSARCLGPLCCWVIKKQNTYETTHGRTLTTV